MHSALRIEKIFKKYILGNNVSMTTVIYSLRSNGVHNAMLHILYRHKDAQGNTEISHTITLDRQKSELFRTYFDYQFFDTLLYLLGDSLDYITLDKKHNNKIYERFLQQNQSSHHLCII